MSNDQEAPAEDSQGRQPVPDERSRGNMERAVRQHAPGEQSRSNAKRAEQQHVLSRRRQRTAGTGSAAKRSYSPESRARSLSATTSS